MKTNTQPKLHISLSKEHNKYQSDVADAFKGLDISFDGGLMRFSAQEMAMQIILNLGISVLSSAMWDAIKVGVKKLHKKFNTARVTLRDSDSIMYTVKPDLSVTVLAVPDRMKEFAHIKNLDDLVVHFQKRSKVDSSKDWKMVTLGDLFDFKNGLNSEKENFGHGVRFINIMEILKHDSLVATDIPGRINVDPKRNKENTVEYGDVLFNRTSETPDEVGMTSVYLDHEPVVFGGFVIRAKPKTKELNDLFKKYCFSSEKFRKEVIKQGQGVVRGNIGQSNLRVIPFLLPPKEEQVRIVSILETWNQVIEKLSKKIEVKKQVKKALMQKLLSGKKRLSGFNDVWEATKLGNLIGNVSARNKDLKVTRVLSVTNKHGFILPEKQFARVVASEDLSNYKVISRGDFAYNPSRINVGSISRLDEYDGGILSPMYISFRTNKNVDSDYLYHWLDTSEANGKIKRCASGSVRESVDFKSFCSIKIKIPKIKEQEAIVNILNTSEKGILELEKKLQIIKEQKKYLLNNLITGTIRTPETLSVKLTK
jgi:type I restriction enzyme S subunit